jgi:tRNA (cytidine/uridine-2'-O-)-methyltransferase
MFEIVLFQPEIPPNTGNIIRLSANVGARLHLVKPLGFSLSHKALMRAGLDYHDLAHVHVHEDWASLKAALPKAFSDGRVFSLSTHGTQAHTAFAFEPGDVFVFGPETSGLPVSLREEIGTSRCVRLPMRPGNRSLNLSNAVAIVAYEAWRQNGFAGGLTAGDPLAK